MSECTRGSRFTLSKTVYCTYACIKTIGSSYSAGGKCDANIALSYVGKQLMVQKRFSACCLPCGPVHGHSLQCHVVLAIIEMDQALQH